MVFSLHEGKKGTNFFYLFTVMGKQALERLLLWREKEVQKDHFRGKKYVCIHLCIYTYIVIYCIAPIHTHLYNLY